MSVVPNTDGEREADGGEQQTRDTTYLCNIIEWKIATQTTSWYSNEGDKLVCGYLC